jgi:hypothetical protein
MQHQTGFLKGAKHDQVVAKTTRRESFLEGWNYSS